MADRVTVNFFHLDRPDVQWAWSDASGHVPAPGDHVITPQGTHWTVAGKITYPSPGSARAGTSWTATWWSRTTAGGPPMTLHERLLAAIIAEGRHIAGNDPAFTLRACAPDLERLQRHCPAWWNPRLCAGCAGCATFEAAYPCYEIKSLAAVYVVSLEDTSVDC